MGMQSVKVPPTNAMLFHLLLWSTIIMAMNSAICRDLCVFQVFQWTVPQHKEVWTQFSMACLHRNCHSWECYQREGIFICLKSLLWEVSTTSWTWVSQWWAKTRRFEILNNIGQDFLQREGELGQLNGTDQGTFFFLNSILLAYLDVVKEKFIIVKSFTTDWFLCLAMSQVVLFHQQYLMGWVCLTIRYHDSAEWSSHCTFPLFHFFQWQWVFLPACITLTSSPPILLCSLHVDDAGVYVFNGNPFEQNGPLSVGTRTLNQLTDGIPLHTEGSLVSCLLK